MIYQVVFLISGQGYFIFLYRYPKHNLEGGRKEHTNKHGLGSAPSARNGEVYVTLFIHSVFLWVNGSVYSSENSHEAVSNADLTSCVGPPGISRSTGPRIRWLVPSLPDSHLPDWPVLSTGPFLLTVFFCSLLLTSSSLGPYFRRLSGLVVIVRPINMNVSCKLHPYCLQRTQSPPGPRLPRRIGNTYPHYYKTSGKGYRYTFSFFLSKRIIFWIELPRPELFDPTE